jgi:hypothetical protein
LDLPKASTLTELIVQGCDSLEAIDLRVLLSVGGDFAISSSPPAKLTSLFAPMLATLGEALPQGDAPPSWGLFIGNTQLTTLADFGRHEQKDVPGQPDIPGLKVGSTSVWFMDNSQLSTCVIDDWVAATGAPAAQGEGNMPCVKAE